MPELGTNQPGTPATQPAAVPVDAIPHAPAPAAAPAVEKTTAPSIPVIPPQGTPAQPSQATQIPSPRSAPASVPDGTSKAILTTGEEPRDLNRKKSKSSTDQPAKQRSGLIPAMLVLLGLVAIGGTAVFFASKELDRNVDSPMAKASAGDPSATETSYIRIGWQKDAYQVLAGYMAATEAKGKLPYVLNGPQLEKKIEDFYGGGMIVDTDTPAETFSVYELSEEDRRRGLFMMIYDQPPQFDMKEFFRPLASLEVQYGVDEADLLLSTLARVGNFAMEPLRVHAFFKRTPEGLKLDWEIFAQTKYRTFQNFVELPEPGHTGVFRVFVVEDVPDKGKAVAGTRTYRLVDPANTTDIARVNVNVDSDAGKELTRINWRGTAENRPITRTATVELKWNEDTLEISRFICWEFLGLGGEDSASTASSN